MEMTLVTSNHIIAPHGRGEQRTFKEVLEAVQQPTRAEKQALRGILQTEHARESLEITAQHVATQQSIEL